MYCFLHGLFSRLWVSWRFVSDALLHPCPCHLDRVEVRGVGRQVEERTTNGGSDLCQIAAAVDGGVVQHEYRTRGQAWKQIIAKKRLDIVSAHRAFLLPGTQHSRSAQRSQQRQVFAAPIGNGLDQTLATRCPAIEAMQRQRETGLVQKDKSLRRDRGYLFPESRPLLRIALGGDAALFLYVIFKRRNVSDRTLTVTATGAPVSFCHASASAASVQSLHEATNARNASCCSGLILGARPGKGVAAKLPVVFKRDLYRLTVVVPTENRAAVCAIVKPEDKASTMRWRRSTE